MAGLEQLQDVGQMAKQDYAIQTLLEQRLTPEDILVTVRMYNRAAEHQFHEIFALIATIPSEALLLARIQAIRKSTADPKTQY